MTFQVHKKEVVGLFMWGEVGFLFFFLEIHYFDFYVLLACETYSPNVSSECLCWYFTLSTFFLQELFSTVKLLFIPNWSLFKRLQSKLKLETLSIIKNIALKREESNFRFFYLQPSPSLSPPPPEVHHLWLFLRRRINKESMHTKISCICDSGQNAWNGNEIYIDSLNL